jgi:hypothetical protein
LKISTDREIRYPFYVVPFHACYDIEVRKDGMPFPRIMHSSSAIELGIMFAGNLCGSLLLPGMPKHTGSIPLHVMYRFDRPGAYEVRYLRRATALGSKSPEVTSPWTRIEIEPATPEDRTRWLADVSAHARIKPDKQNYRRVNSSYRSPEDIKPRAR